MKDIDECNYYELLEIPEDASKIAIREAYHASCALFDEGSTVSYNFFSDQEREALLKRLQVAYETLADNNKRIAYDKETFDRIGKWYQPAAHVQTPPDQGRVEQHGKEKRCEIDLRDYLNEDGLISLSELREAVRITPEEISIVIKVRVSMILALESRDFSRLPPPTYIKGYLKSYAQTLGIKPDELVEAYGPLDP